MQLMAFAGCMNALHLLCDHRKLDHVRQMMRGYPPAMHKFYCGVPLGEDEREELLDFVMRALGSIFLPEPELAEALCYREDGHDQALFQKLVHRKARDTLLGALRSHPWDSSPGHDRAGSR